MKHEPALYPMNWLQRLLLGKDLTNKLEQKAEPFARFEISGGRLVTPVDNKDTYIKDGYGNDIVFSVINMILDKIRMPDWNLFKVVDEAALKDYNTLLRKKDFSGLEYKKALNLRHKALEPITNLNVQQGKLNDLLKYPNQDESFQDFIAYSCLYKLLTGDSYIWGNILSAGANKGIPNELNVLPSQHVTIDISEGFPVRAAGYNLVLFNQKFRPEEIVHEIYSNPNWNINGEQLYGYSPLKSYLKNLCRNNSAKDASAAKFQNGGVEELIYVNDNRWTPEQGKIQAEAVKRVLNTKEFRGPQAQGKFAVSGIPMGSVKLGSTPVELGIIDSERWDAIMFCNGYGVPPELFGLVNKTFNNAKEGEKALTTRSVLPLLIAKRNKLNRQFQTVWGFKGQNIYTDFQTEIFSELQADQAETAQWVNSLIMATPDEIRELFNMDSLNTKESKEVWVKTASGWQPLSDFQAGQVDQIMNSIDQTVNGGQQNVNGSGAGTSEAAKLRAIGGNR